MNNEWKSDKGTKHAEKELFFKSLGTCCQGNEQKTKKKMKATTVAHMYTHTHNKCFSKLDQKSRGKKQKH